MKLYLCIIFFITSTFHAQTNAEGQIELLLKKSLKDFTEIRFNESLKESTDALKLSEKNNYSRGKTVSCIYIAKVLLEVGIYKEGLNYLEKAEKEPFFETSIDFKVETCRLRGRTYGNLKMYLLAAKEFQQQLQYSYKIEDKIKRSFSLIWAHQNLSHIFEIQGKKDSLWKHLNNQENILKTLDEKETYHMLYTTYTQKANEYIIINNFSSAEIYLKKATDLLKKYNVSYQHDILEVYGNLKNKKGDQKEAIEYYEKALQNALKIGDGDATKHLYKILADYYTENTSDIKKANEYLHKYQQINDSIDLQNKQAAEIALNQIVEKKDKEVNGTLLHYLYFIAAIILVFLPIIIFFYLRNRKQRLLLEKRKEMIEETHKHLKILEQKLQISLEEIIEEARKNSPTFLEKFQFFNPEFTYKLIQICPELNSGELILLAYIYLNFSSKEIADYTFRSYRTIQTRKYALRKKLGLQTKDNFYVWLKNIDDNSNL